MLRRLFISLIILSTLASEGIMNIPVNISNILMCLNTETGTVKNTGVFEENAKELQEYSRITFNAFRLTDSSILKLRLSNKRIFLSNVNTGYTHNHFSDILNIHSTSNLADSSSLQIEKSIILLKSDTSPPLI